MYVLCCMCVCIYVVCMYLSVVRAKRLVEIEEERCAQQERLAAAGSGQGLGLGLGLTSAQGLGLGVGLSECLLDDKEGSDWDDLSQSTAHL